jgi:ATP-binding cassette subfamily B protein
MFWSPIRNLASLYNKIVNNLSGAERIFDILDTEPELTDRPDAYPLPPIEGRVEFDHVTFAYPDEPERDVIRDICFDIKPGETIALVGPTGAGKTTIINLLSRFYEVKSGEIRIDGNPIQKVTMESLRSQMGIMTQENFMFSGTIADNIRYGKLDATDEEVIWAAKTVGAHDFIMKLEKGYDTPIQSGSGLSVGQRQLVAFARTLIGKPRVLILDEATSSIDTHTEIMVQNGIEALLAGRTSFVIAHRLSTIRKADRIFVVDHQGIMEAGTHRELLEKKGAYYQLYCAQFKDVLVS